MSKGLEGVFLPITTPFEEDGALALDRLEETVRFYAGSGVNGYLVLGSNGENKSLTGEEKLRVARTVMVGRAPDQTVMAGSIFESTAETIDFGRELEKLGADYITLLPPNYFGKAMNDRVLIRYFTDVASALETPCLLYNAPQYAGGVSISINTLKACAEHPNIVGIKDSSSGSIDRYLLTVEGTGFRVMSGSINTFLPALLGGATGGIISLANSQPGPVCQLYRCVREGDMTTALAYNRAMLRANLVISGKYGVAGVKAAMELAGLYGGPPRLPLLPLEAEQREEVKQAVDRLLREI